MLAYKELVGLPEVSSGDPCYQLVRKAYKLWFDISLTDYAVPNDWDHSGLNLIIENYYNEGFRLVEEPVHLAKDGDILVIKIQSPVPNHLGVVVGNQVLHQAYGRRSEVQPLGGVWRNQLCAHLRHKDIILPQPVKQTCNLGALLSKQQQEALHAVGASWPDTTG